MIWRSQEQGDIQSNFGYGMEERVVSSGMENRFREGRVSGGWNPVLRRKEGNNIGVQNDGLFTIFVDNIPESMGPKSMYILFNKFGAVKDVFIPAKRRIVTGTRFGFIRFDCSVAKNLAVQKANGLWVEDKELEVKNARFTKPQLKQHRAESSKHLKIVLQRRSKQDLTVAGGQKSYAKVVKSGATDRKDYLVAKAFELDNEWLSVSLIVKLKNFLSFPAFRDEVCKKGLGEILVRRGRGRSVVLTFNSSQAIKEGYDQLKGWIYDWCVSVTKWRKEVNLDQERCVWLCCYGVPFNLWNANTFKSIGSLWGEVIQVVEVNNSDSLEYGKVRLLTNSMKPINTVISLEYKGNIYPVRICETFDFHEDVALKFSAGNDQISINWEKRVWRQKTVLSSNSNKLNESSSTINQCVKRNGFYGRAMLNLVQMKPFNLRSVLGPQHKYGRVHSLFWRPKSTAVDLGVSIEKNKIVQVPYEPSSLFSLGPKGIVEGVDVVEKSSIPIMSSNSVKIEESSRRHEGGGVHKASYPNNASQRNKERKKKFLKASLVLPKFKRWGIGLR